MAADETDNRRTRSFSAWKSVRLGETEDLIEGLKANPVDEEDFFDLDIRTINSFIPKQNMKRTRPQEVSHRGMDKANAHEWFWGGCQRRGGGNDSTLSYFICGGGGGIFWWQSITGGGGGGGRNSHLHLQQNVIAKVILTFINCYHCWCSNSSLAANIDDIRCIIHDLTVENTVLFVVRS